MSKLSDFIVVGGGIAGASAGFELAAHGTVTLLEREATCGMHSTGRSAALFTECYGDTVVRRLAIASRRFLAEPPPGFSDVAILSPRSLLFVATDQQAASVAAAEPDFQAYVPAVHRVDRAEALRMCPALDPRYVASGLVEPDAMDIDVHALHLGYLAGIRRAGGKVTTSAEVLYLSRHGGVWSVTTPSDTFQAPIVVNAAGAWVDAVAAVGRIEPIGLVPNRRTAFTFDPQRDHGGWPMIVDIDEQFYFKPEGPHILASPADETPLPPCDVRHEEIDVALGIERIEQATSFEIRHVRSAWAGLRSFVADRRPVVGEDPAHPGFFWLAGQGGYGIKTSPAMARALTGLVVDHALPNDLTALGIAADHLSPERLVRTGR